MLVRDVSFNPETCSTLETALIQDTANCYAIALLYLLHLRLEEFEVSLFAVPGHVVLCFPSKEGLVLNEEKSKIETKHG